MAKKKQAKTTSVALPLKWHGGKGAFDGKLAKWIISHMPPHLTYVEPYFGGGAVLFHKPCEGVSEIVNDISWELTNFWRVLQQTPDRMLHALWATPFSAVEFDAATKAAADTDAVRRATAFFIRCRQSRQGLGKDFATLSTGRVRRGMNEQVSAYLSSIEGLPDARDRLQRVLIYCEEAVQVIKRTDSKDTFFYLDPTYLPETRSAPEVYEHEMTREQHVTLLETLETVEGKFLLSCYYSELYDEFAKRNGWNWLTCDIVNNASGKKTKDVKVECLLRNFSE